MTTRIPRRTLIGAGPLALAACKTADAGYFGRVEPPKSRRLIYLIGAEPATLDPAKSVDRWETYIVHAMFEGLTSFHPRTGEPTAALATHFEVTRDGLRYKFYLRGHGAPRGARLPNTTDLPRQFSRGRFAPPDSAPARWSDGAPVTAHDIVYSWRRALDPATAATYAYLMYYLRNAEEVSAGKLSPENLALRATDDFSLDIELRTPTPFLPQLLSHRVFCAVSRRSIETYGPAWTEPGHIVASGAFILQEHRPNDRIVLTSNREYYEAGIVGLDEIAFIPVVDGSATLNLYKTGYASVMQPLLPQLFPFLRAKQDFRTHAMYGAVYPLINTTKLPFSDVRARYALNMATDKRAVADFVGAGRRAALNLVPPLHDYEPPRDLRVSIDGAYCDVLSYNPPLARELFVKAAGGRPPFRIEFLFPNLPEAKPVAEILQQQWKHALGIELVLVKQELQTWLQTVFSKSFSGVAYWGDTAYYLDPTWFLDQFTASSAANATGWIDPRYDSALAEAARTPNRSERMSRLAASERQLLAGMPFIPLYTDSWTYLCKPFVKGLGANPFDCQQWKYVWIDTNWGMS
jgi:oligopeptide transport system substrate-binding protein